MAGFLLIHVRIYVSFERDYISPMKTVSIREAHNRFDELAQEVEQGETVTVTRRDGEVFRDHPMVREAASRCRHTPVSRTMVDPPPPRASVTA